MTPDEARAALEQKIERGHAVDAELKRKRATARSRAQADARQALTVIHRDEYHALYAVALEKRAAEIGVEL